MENAVTYVSNDECLLSVHIGFPKSQENESLNTKHQHAWPWDRYRYGDAG